MITGVRRALALGWKSRFGTGGIREEEVEVPRSQDSVLASLFMPNQARSPLPGWVVLHGVTRPGRNHPTLVQFARALAGSGAIVLVPEIREWRNLDLAPEEATETIRASVLALSDRQEVIGTQIGIMGTSFGVSHALQAATDSVLKEHLRVAVGFGGYCSLSRTLRFLFRGEHEWMGRRFKGDPDPYGRWVVTGNYLTRVPGFEDAGDVADALLRLARHASDVQVGSWHERFDPVKEELAGTIEPSRRELFRGIAPPAGNPPDTELSETIAEALAKAGETASPLFRPASLVDGIEVPVRLVHGREDRLIPFTESLRLKEAFAPEANVRVDLTCLLAHSRRDGAGGSDGEFVEQLRFLRIMANILGLV
jgi:hypothetical protein